MLQRTVRARKTLADIRCGKLERENFVCLFEIIELLNTLFEYFATTEIDALSSIFQPFYFLSLYA